MFVCGCAADVLRPGILAFIVCFCFDLPWLFWVGSEPLRTVRAVYTKATTELEAIRIKSTAINNLGSVVVIRYEWRRYYGGGTLFLLDFSCGVVDF